MLKKLAGPLLLLMFGAVAVLVVGEGFGIPWLEDWLARPQGAQQRTVVTLSSAEGAELDQSLAAALEAKRRAEAARAARQAALAVQQAELNDADAQAASARAGGGDGARAGSDAATDNEPQDDQAEGADEDEEEPEQLPIETQEGQQFNPNVHGRLQEVSERRIRGWVQDRNEPEGELFVQVTINEIETIEQRAAQRQDHASLGIIWIFEITEPEQLKARERHVVRAFVFRRDQHGRTELAASPRTREVGNVPRGRLEAASPEGGIRGYAWDPDAPNQPAKVIVRVNGETIAELTANVKNEELLRRRITPRDNCAFEMPWPEALNDGEPHTLQVFVVDAERGSEHEIDGSPRPFRDRAGMQNAPPVGRLQIVNKVVIAGWSWDPDAGNGSNDVEIWINDQLYTTIAANSRNDNLRNSGQTPTQHHGFVVTTPGLVLDGRTHVIRAYGLNYPHGPKVELEGSPRQYRVEENSDPMGGFWRADENLLRGWAADPDLGTRPCEIEIYINGKLWKRTVADRREEWLIGTGYAPNPEHGFAIQPPEWVKDGERHEVTIYAINYPEGPPRHLGTRTIGVNSVFPGFWVGDRLLDSRIQRGLQVTSVSPWFDAFDKGVKAGDVLLEFEGLEAGHTETRDSAGNVTRAGTMTADLRIWLNSNKQRNDIVRFVFWRDGETYEAQIRMGQLSGQ